MSPAVTVDVQRSEALRAANSVRIAGCQIRQEVAAGRTTLADALFDERAQSMPIGRLLEARPRWGKVKAARLMRTMEIYPGRHVRDLTDRQKRLIAKATR